MSSPERERAARRHAETFLLVLAVVALAGVVAFCVTGEIRMSRRPMLTTAPIVPSFGWDDVYKLLAVVPTLVLGGLIYWLERWRVRRKAARRARAKAKA